ncbi:MAG: hypothetical protein ABR556_12735 [Pyrinomonadaceae bacterium]
MRIKELRQPLWASCSFGIVGELLDARAIGITNPQITQITQIQKLIPPNSIRFQLLKVPFLICVICEICG